MCVVGEGHQTDVGRAVLVDVDLVDDGVHEVLHLHVVLLAHAAGSVENEDDVRVGLANCVA